MRADAQFFADEFAGTAYPPHSSGERQARGSGTIVVTRRQVHDRRTTIISNPDLMMGKPVVAGTRITVELILEKLAAGESVEDILAAHPRLNEESIRAALAFAADALRADVLYPVETAPR
jgi:uncharacterized protein (DUF433 family)